MTPKHHLRHEGTKIILSSCQIHTEREETVKKNNRKSHELTRIELTSMSTLFFMQQMFL